jgi:hypothetical protein
LILKYATASTGATSGSPAFYLRGIKKRKKNAGVRMAPTVFAYVKTSLMPAAKYDSRNLACQSVSDGLLGEEKTKQKKELFCSYPQRLLSGIERCIGRGRDI